MNGRRSAATTGGSTALSTAISTAATTASTKLCTLTPGTMAPAISRAAAVTSSDSNTCSSRKCGACGAQPVSP